MENGRLLVLRVSAPLFVQLRVVVLMALAASLKPESVKLAIAAFTSTVIVHAAVQDAASMVTALDDVGTAQPPAPPVVSDHRAAALQLPVPPTQKREVPQATS